jgi:hypothetical protein
MHSTRRRQDRFARAFGGGPRLARTSLDRDCARRPTTPGRDGETTPGLNKETAACNSLNRDGAQGWPSRAARDALSTAHPLEIRSQNKGAATPRLSRPPTQRVSSAGMPHGDGRRRCTTLWYCRGCSRPEDPPPTWPTLTAKTFYSERIPNARSHEIGALPLEVG